MAEQAQALAPVCHDDPPARGIARFSGQRGYNPIAVALPLHCLSFGVSLRRTHQCANNNCHLVA